MVSNDNDGVPQPPNTADEFDEDEEFDEDDEEEFDDDEDDEDEDDEGDEQAEERPLAHKRSSGSSSFGPAIAGIMHGIDADIFRDPAAIQRMQRDRTAVVRTADGTVIGIELPGEGIIDVQDPEADEPI